MDANPTVPMSGFFQPDSVHLTCNDFPASGPSSLVAVSNRNLPCAPGRGGSNLIEDTAVSAACVALEILTS